MTRLRFLFDEEEKKEKFGWAQRTRGIGELPKYEFGKIGLEKAKEIEIPESTKLKFTAGVGIGAKAEAGVSLAKPEEELPEPEPTWGEVIKHSLKSGLGQFQASLVNLIRLVDMGVTKITDPIQIMPIDFSN